MRTQGPHLELWPQGRAGFTPLKLMVQPGGAEIELNTPGAVVGRHSGADIRLAFPEISRRHCQFTFDDGQWRVIDLDSMNGVYVNGERMYESVVYDGDRVRVGFCVMTIERGTPVRVVTPPRKSDPELEVLQRIADVLPRQAG